MRFVMELSDSQSIPGFIIDGALNQLNEELEGYFFEALLKLYDKQKEIDNKKSHEIAAGIKDVARTSFNHLMTDPIGVLRNEAFQKGLYLAF